MEYFNLMKRWITSLAVASLSAVIMAQAPFTIVRPADGSKVREKVRILIPKNSLPPGGYVGVFLDNKLVEATVPPVEGNYRVYTLDTKGRGIADTTGTPLKLELVLYTDYNDQARIVDRSSIDIHIGNKANIAIPNSGLNLRYRFSPGTQFVYNLHQYVQVATISEQQQRNGGRAAQVDTESEKIRLLYAVDNAYGDGSGLLRMQALPQKGKDYAMLTTSADLVQKRYYADQMAPIYMKITNTGREVYSALPPSVPLFGTNAGALDATHLYAPYPLPMLPSKAVRPGDAWAASFQMGAVNLDEYPNIDTITAKLPARGEFLGVEWEQGHPCAKLKNSIEAAGLTAADKDRIGKAAGGQSIEDDKFSISETIWFALDSRKVLKAVRDITVDRKTAGAAGGMGGAGAPGGMGGSMGSPGMFKGGAMGGGAVGAGQRGGGGDEGLAGPQGGGAQLGGRAPGAGPAPGGSRGGQMGGMGGAPSTPQYVRVRMIQIFTLEQ